MNTDKELVETLISRNYDGRYDELIERCKEGIFHDFKSELPAPKVNLVIELYKFPELADLVQSVKRGLYDEDIE